MKKFLRLAICAALIVTPFGYASAGAGQTVRFGDYYELNEFVDCNNTFACVLNFTDGAPSDKFFRIRYINCFIRSGRVVDGARLNNTPANSNVQYTRSRFFIPGRYELSAGKYESNINEQTDFIIGPTTRPSVTVTTVTTGTSSQVDTYAVGCLVTGTLQ